MKLSRRQKKTLILIAAAVVLLIAAALIPAEGIVRLLLFLPAYLCVGWQVLVKAAKNICRGQIFDENFLMALASVGAFATAEYAEAVIIMLFYQVGELFESVAVDRSRQSISDMMDIRPEYVNLQRNGEWVECDPEDAQVGEIMLIKPGEKIPLDGEIIEGRSQLNTVALTGESLPREVECGDSVISGCINGSGTLQARIRCAYSDSTVAKILELIENSASSKAKSETFITKFAAWYTPCVVIAAALLALLPSLIWGNWTEWVHRAMTFLVISCPCALVISVPLSYFGGIGGASRNGILIKGSNHLEALADAELISFDKTGTLTKGSFAVTSLHPADTLSEKELLQITAAAERFSDHPIAQAIVKACDDPIPVAQISDSREIAGKGVSVSLNGKTVLAGNLRLMQDNGIACAASGEVGTIVHTAIDGRYAGYIVIADSLKEETKDALAELHAMGLRRTVMLTGDRTDIARQIAAEAGVDEVKAELLPADKVACVSELLKEKSPKGKLLYVGDGINDAPVLAASDIGIAMGSLGSDAAIEAADIVIMDDNLQKIPTMLRIAKKVRVIVTENITFALAVKAVVLILGALGRAPIWAAVFSDVGVSVLAILNASRTLKKAK